MISGGCQDTQGTAWYGVCWDMGALGAARTPRGRGSSIGSPWTVWGPPHSQGRGPVTPPALRAGSTTPFLHVAGAGGSPPRGGDRARGERVPPKRHRGRGTPAPLWDFTPGPPESRLWPLPGAGFHRPFHKTRGGGGTRGPAHAVPIGGAGEPTDVSNYCPIWRLLGPANFWGSAAKEQPQHCSPLYNGPSPARPRGRCQRRASHGTRPPPRGHGPQTYRPCTSPASSRWLCPP